MCTSWNDFKKHVIEFSNCGRAEMAFSLLLSVFVSYSPFVVMGDIFCIFVKTAGHIVVQCSNPSCKISILSLQSGIIAYC